VTAEFSIWRSDAVDQNSFEARVSIDRTFPVAEPAYRFSTPRRGFMKRRPNSRANRAIGWDRHGLALQPVAGVDMSGGESISRRDKEHGPAFRLGAGRQDRAGVTNQRGPATL
jgi:hypothetical protein